MAEEGEGAGTVEVAVEEGHQAGEEHAADHAEDDAKHAAATKIPGAVPAPSPARAAQKDGGGNGTAYALGGAMAGAMAVAVATDGADGKAEDEPDADPYERSTISKMQSGPGTSRQVGTGFRRRRMWRITVLFALCVFGFVVYMLAALLKGISETNSYDPNNELAIVVRGCDVSITTGAENTVQIERWLGQASSHTFLWNAAGTHTVHAIADNVHGCKEALGNSCDRICKVTVTVPSGTGATRPRKIYVVQRGDDKADYIVTRVHPGVKVQELRIDGPSVTSFIDQVDVSGGLTVRGVGGNVWVRDSVYAKSDLRATRGSVYVLDTKPRDHNMDLQFRSTGNKVCVAARGNTASVTAGSVWQEPARTWTGCNLDMDWWARKALAHYDKDNDFMITSSEFAAGLAAMPKCCGGLCPVLSLCGALEFQMFPINANSGDNSLSGRSGIVTNSEFLKRLKDLNDTTAVPLCLAHASVTTDTAVTSRRTTKVYADAGEFRIMSTAVDDATVPRDTSLGGGKDTVNSTYWAPSGKTVGMTILQRDFDVLKEKVQTVYGSPDKTEDVVAVIDVLPSPGIPSGRWIYATRPIYINIDPSYLSFLSAGLLTPKVEYYRVTLVNGDCDENATRVGPDGQYIDLEQRTMSVYQQLYNALVPRFQLEMRGVLVYVRPEHRPPPETRALSMFQRNFGTGNVEMLDFQTANDGMAVAAQILSVVIGVIVSFVATILFVAYMRNALKEQHKAEKIKTRLLELQLEASLKKAEEDTKADGVDETAAKEAAKEAADAADANKDGTDGLDEDAQGRSFNPFETPLELITLLLVRPMRRKFVNSVTKFVNERCIIKPPAVTWHKEDKKNKNVAVDISKGVPTVSMDQFVDAYSKFCYRGDLKELHDRKEIQRMLITEYDLRVAGTLVERVRGIKWKEGGEATVEAYNAATLATSQADTAVAASAAAAATSSGNAFGAPSAEEHHDIDDNQLVKEFVERFCEVTRKYTDDVIELGPSATTKGFSDMFEEFCEAHLVEPPDLTKAMLEPLGVKLVKRRIRTIRGLTFLDFKSGGRAKLSGTWYFVEFLTVVLHMFFLYMLPIIVITFAMQMQYTYANTMAPVPSVTFFDVMTFPPDFSDLHLMLIVQIVVITMFVYMGLATLRMLLHYCSFKPGLFTKIVRKSFAFVLTLMVFFGFTYAGIVATWFLLAAILDPTQYLPYGAAVATIGVVAMVTWRAMIKAATTLKNKIAGAFKKHLQETMKKARTAMFNSARLDRRKGLAGLKRRKAPAAAQEEDETDFEVGDIFQLLNTDGDQYLSRAEFDDLFDKLQLNVNPRKREQMFAYCDADGSGTITQDEFVDAWEWVEKQMLLEAAEDMGLSDGAIAGAVISVIVLLGLIFAFIFIAMMAWSNAGSFNAVVQSCLVAGTGKVADLAKKRPRSKEELDEAIDGIVEGAQPEEALPTA